MRTGVGGKVPASLPVVADKTLWPKAKQDGSWPSDEEWPRVPRMVVCATKGCPFEGIGFSLALPVGPDGLLRVVCHQCQEYAVDLREDLSPVGEDTLEELKANPKLFREKRDEFKKRKRDEEKDSSPKLS